MVLSSVRSTDYWVNMGEFDEMGWAGAGTYQSSWPLKKMDMLSLPLLSMSCLDLILSSCIG